MDERTILISSGGTIVPIDDVRHVGNRSTGLTGASIAEYFLSMQASLSFLMARGSLRPFERELKDLFYHSEKLDDLIQLKKKQQEFQKNWTPIFYSTFEEYERQLETWCLGQEAPLVILSAAVSDFGVQRQKGKISSKSQTLTLELYPLDKVIKKVRLWNSAAVVVGFKLLVEGSPQSVLTQAFDSHSASGAVITVLNTVTTDFDIKTTYLLTENGFVEIPDRTKMPQALYCLLDQSGYL